MNICKFKKNICILHNFADCPEGYHGYNCSKCSNSCQTCVSTNGKCLSCVDPSKCGDYCNNLCQSNFPDAQPSTDETQGNKENETSDN